MANLTTTPTPAPTITTADAAALIGVNLDQVQALIRRRKLPAINVSSGTRPVYRLKHSDVLDFIERRSTTIEVGDE
ncbi:helix-turn-helix domain-containing protein [Deinococcus sonorensis]|uniref:Helix-turn-helix domain-containing protein n=2 Tax=Deinococcus sonorensis TaxID=309891 RepID=A0AAU7UCT2_9DEIO